MAIDPATINAAAATRLNTDISDELEAATDAAFQYIENDTGTKNDDPLDPWDPADALLTQGLVLLSMRIFQDSPVLSGALSGFDDPAFAGVVVPTRLYSHLDQYWSHLAEQFGVA